MKVCLDLFSGLGGFSAAFGDSEEWGVLTVDLNPDGRFDPDMEADILELKPPDILEKFAPDARRVITGEKDGTFIILASPPCTDFSIAASRYEKIVDGEPQTPEARESVLLVYHTMGLIKSLSPDYWFMENPTGYLRQIIGNPEGRVTYCQYGLPYMKPTDLWGYHPIGFQYRSCGHGDDCHQYNTDWENGGEGGMDTLPDYSSDPAVRAKIPYELSESILESVEKPEENINSASEVDW